MAGSGSKSFYEFRVLHFMRRVGTEFYGESQWEFVQDGERDRVVTGKMEHPFIYLLSVKQAYYRQR